VWGGRERDREKERVCMREREKKKERVCVNEREREYNSFDLNEKKVFKLNHQNYEIFVDFIGIFTCKHSQIQIINMNEEKKFS
jgi:hypothetical protein